MRIDDKTYSKMPDNLKRLFIKLPNPGSEEVMAGFPQTGKSSGGSGEKSMGGLGKSKYGKYALDRHGDNAGGLGDCGSAARFFYCAKASKAERNMGCEGLDAVIRNDGRARDLASGDMPQNRSNNAKKNHHPTVKPLSLMRYLCRLITPPGGTVLDPFAGSGTTVIAALQEGFNAIGIEKEPEYAEIARCRIKSVEKVDKQINIFSMGGIAE